MVVSNQKGGKLMKKTLTSVIAIGCLTAAGSAYAGLGAGTGVNGSLHDMTKVVQGTADNMGRVCVYCHAPHHSKPKDTYSPGTGIPDTTAQYPLWNHKFSTQTFSPYIWATPDNQGIAGNINDPLIGPSRLCMTCHDGNVAVDEHGAWQGTQAQGGTSQNFIQNIPIGDGARANLSPDLTNTHPIGFDYNYLAANRNRNVSNGANGLGADGATEIVPSNNHYADSIVISDTDGYYNQVSRNQGGKRIVDNLYNGSILTCATCNEVHNKENVVQDTYKFSPVVTPFGTQTRPNYFLYAKETNSLICLSCHVK